MTSSLLIQLIVRFGIAALLTATTTAQQAPVVNNPAEKASEAKTEQEQTAPANNPAQQDAAFGSWKDKLSYAVGADLARGLKWQRVDVNVDMLIKALRDGLAGSKMVLTQEEVTATLKRFEDEQKKDYDHAKMMLSERNQAAGEAFFAENLKKEGVVTLPSGLQYKILKKGDGKLPTLDNKVVCQYRAMLLDGTEIDSSEKRGHAVTLPVKGLMAGWTQALQMMAVGSKWQLFLPPQLAYGEKSVSGIGPNATLIFEVELLSIEDKTASAAK